MLFLLHCATWTLSHWLPPLSPAAEPTSNPSSRSFTPPAFPQLSNESRGTPHQKTFQRQDKQYLLLSPCLQRQLFLHRRRPGWPGVMCPWWSHADWSWRPPGTSWAWKWIPRACAVHFLLPEGGREGCGPCHSLDPHSLVLAFFPVIKEVSRLFYWRLAAVLYSHHLQPQAFVRKTCAVYEELCSALTHVSEQNHRDKFFLELRLRWMNFCTVALAHALHVLATRVNKVWLSLKKCTKPICVHPYPHQPPSPQNQPWVSRLQSHGQKFSSTKVRVV